MAREYGRQPDEPKHNSPVIDRETTEAPTAEQVTLFHKNADTDVRAEAIHHTLGNSPHQAAAGDHRHDGNDSSLLLEGMVITGSTTANPPTAVLNSIIQCLVRLGARDNTS